MGAIGYRLGTAVLAALVFVVFVAGCARPLDLQVEARATYVGPDIDDVNVRLTPSYGLDYAVKVSCAFTNVGDPGRVDVLAKIAQGDESWVRSAVVQSIVGQPTTTDFVFDEPTFTGGDAQGSCEADPHAADMRWRLECVVSNAGGGSGPVTVIGSRNDEGQQAEIDIGAEGRRTVPFVFEVVGTDDRLECKVKGVSVGMTAPRIPTTPKTPKGAADEELVALNPCGAGQNGTKETIYRAEGTPARFRALSRAHGERENTTGDESGRFSGWDS